MDCQKLSVLSKITSASFSPLNCPYFWNYECVLVSLGVLPTQNRWIFLGFVSRINKEKRVLKTAWSLWWKITSCLLNLYKHMRKVLNKLYLADTSYSFRPKSPSHKYIWEYDIQILYISHLVSDCMTKWKKKRSHVDD